MNHAAIDTRLRSDARALLGHGGVPPVDVREPEGYAAEQVRGAPRCPLSTFDVAAVPTDGPRRLVFRSASGQRSLVAGGQGPAEDSSRATHMGCGLAAWKQAAVPVISANANH
jgi:rhodanese-related sulfurtransferase